MKFIAVDAFGELDRPVAVNNLHKEYFRLQSLLSFISFSRETDSKGFSECVYQFNFVCLFIGLFFCFFRQNLL